MRKPIACIFRVVFAIVIAIVWIGLVALWARSHSWEDLRVWSFPRQIPSAQPGSIRYDILTLVCFAGDGGVCLAERDQGINFAMPPNLSPYVEWIRWKDLEYPHPQTWLKLAANGSSSAHSSFSLRWLPTRQSPLGFGGSGGNSPLPWWRLIAEPYITPANGPLFAAATLRNLNPQTNSDDIIRIVVFPYWSAVALVSALAMIPIVQFRRWWICRRRVAKGLCPTCGYDLRATPDRCPECGAVPATAVGQSQHA